MKIENEREFGKTIKMLRNENDLAQKQLGERVGISNTYICDIETSRVSHSLRVLLNILKKFDLIIEVIRIDNIGEAI